MATETISTPLQATPAMHEIERGMKLNKCQKCGCMEEALQNAEVAFGGPEEPEIRALLPAIADYQTKMHPIAYDCIGCKKCWGADATIQLANNFEDVEPDVCGSGSTPTLMIVVAAFMLIVTVLIFRMTVPGMIAIGVLLLVTFFKPRAELKRVERRLQTLLVIQPMHDGQLARHQIEAQFVHAFHSFEPVTNQLFFDRTIHCGYIKHSFFHVVFSYVFRQDSCTSHKCRTTTTTE